MKREMAIKMAKADLKCMERDTSGQDEMCNSHNCDECRLNYERGNIGEQKEWLCMAIKALEKESESKQFAEWVAREIFDEYWEYNKDAFAEIACRKLAKLGIVREKGDVWELVEPQESEE